MFKIGDMNKGLEQAWSMMPKKAGDKHTFSTKLSVGDILPENRDYYRFNGSLTTPPCSEGVRWLVMKNEVAVSKEQVEAFSHVMQGPNNRPLQPVNARPVLK